MIKVAICDDIPEEIEKLKLHIERYANDNQMQISAFGFSEPDEILSVIDDTDSFDIIFLDIYMKALNGIDLARKTKQQGKKSRIVFVSTSTDHGIDAFGVNAIHYLVKPVAYDAFCNAMDIALSEKNRAEKHITVPSGTGAVRVELDSIVYIEAQKNYQYIHIGNRVVEKTRMTNQAIYEMLGEANNFYRLGVSFIVNLDYVVKITPQTIYFKYGETVQIPRRCYAELEKKYYDYYNMGGMM